VCCRAWNVSCCISLIPSGYNQILMEGSVVLRPIDPNHPIFTHASPKGRSFPMTQINGPMLLPRDPSSALATFDENGQFAAILAADVGQGRAVAISPHPELSVQKDGAEIDNSPLLRDAILWSARQL